ncbi:MAG: MepB family protein [Gammaproteobacteria bacterium]|nr:MepB family protein [Gammaproteobacteria bacterium]
MKNAARVTSVVMQSIAIQVVSTIKINFMITHPDLQLAENLVYKKLNLSCNNIISELESKEYCAATFNLNHHRILFRISKITPTKTGQFVTLWKRINNGPTQPFDLSDLIDFVIIGVRSQENVGQFIFPKTILVQKNIFSKNNVGGKRGIRVYAPWDAANSKQALSTKKWQSEFFIDFNESATLCDRAKHIIQSY